MMNNEAISIIRLTRYRPARSLMAFAKVRSTVERGGTLTPSWL